jgi:deazaflavin-dependent oxidoreductase (nitroreductase family)
MNRALEAALKAPVVMYDVGLGCVVGHRFLLLTHRGRKSGLVHRTMLEVLRWEPGSRTAYVISGLGRGSQWLKNLQAGQGLEVRCGGDRFVPTHRLLTTDEAAVVLEDYERAHGLAARLIPGVLNRLADVDYDGTDASRRRVVEQLPILALTPALH